MTASQYLDIAIHLGAAWLAGSLIGQRVKLNGSTLTIDATGFGDPIPGQIRLVE